MRKRAQVKQQLKQVTFRHLQKRLRDNFKQKPQTCCFNREVLLKEEDGTVVYLCGYTSSQGLPRNIICDDRVPGCVDMARECPLWEPLKTKEMVKNEFNEVVQSGNRGLIASSYPDIAALLWVLDDPEESVVPTESELDEALEEGVDPEPTSGWWAGFKKKLGGG